MDSNYLLNGCDDGIARLYDKSTGNLLFKTKNRDVDITSVEMTDTVILVGYGDGLIDI